MPMHRYFSEGRIVINVFGDTVWALFGAMRLCILCVDMHATFVDLRLQKHLALNGLSSLGSNPYRALRNNIPGYNRLSESEP